MKNTKVRKSIVMLSLMTMSLSQIQTAYSANVNINTSRTISSQSIGFVNTNLLEQAKELASNNTDNRTLFAIMDILREWKKYSSHNQKKSQTKKMIKNALKAAADGRFKTADFIINDITNNVVADDQEVFSNGLIEKLDSAQYDLAAFLARETVRTGQQAGSEYFIEVNRETTVVKKVKTGILFWQGETDKTVVERDSKQLNVFVPELPTSAPVYDKADQEKYNTPHIPLTADDFEKEVVGVLIPYSKVTSSDFSFEDSLIPGAINLAARFVQSVLTGHSHNVVPTKNKLFWNDFYKHNSRYIVGRPFVQFRKYSTRPFFPADKARWGKVILKKFNTVRSILDQMYSQSEEGYKFRMHSKSYDKFVAQYKSLTNSMDIITDLKNIGINFITNEEALRITKPYSILIGDRPDSLETAFEVAMSSANPQIKKLLANAITFSKSTSDSSFETSELNYLSDQDGEEIIDQFSRRNSDALVQNMVDLYMNGKEETVRNIFLKLSSHIQKKVKSINDKLTLSKNNVFTALSNYTKKDISSQLKIVSDAKILLEKSIAESIAPDNYSKEEEFKSIAGTVHNSINMKKIYKSRDIMQYAQQKLRLGFGKSKERIAKAESVFRVNPTIEMREALIDIYVYYHTKMNEMNSEFWPYKKYGKSKVVGWNTSDSGQPVPLIQESVSIESIGLFSDAQLSEYKIETITNIDNIEMSYVKSHLEKIYLSLEKDAIAIGDVYRAFAEYPSHSVSVLLKVSLEDFQKLRRATLTKLTTYNLSSRITDNQKFSDLFSQFTTNIQNINWINEVDDSGKTPGTMIEEIESKRSEYNDLLIPVAIN